MNGNSDYVLSRRNAGNGTEYCSNPKGLVGCRTPGPAVLPLLLYLSLTTQSTILAMKTMLVILFHY